MTQNSRRRSSNEPGVADTSGWRFRRRPPVVHCRDLILAGIFMAYGEGGHRSAVLAASRMFGPIKGEHVADLCTKTIRAVRQGVIASPSSKCS